MTLNKCVVALKNGEVIAYPTEAVFGLGCNPDDQAAIAKLLEIKKRDKAKGLILVAANVEQIEDYVDFSQLSNEIKQQIFATWPGAVTWVMPAGKKCTPLLTGSFDSIAVRISAHPLVRELCLAFGKPITSTSANLTGKQPCKSFFEVRSQLGDKIESILEGMTAGAEKPSEIRDARTGNILRQG